MREPSPFLPAPRELLRARAAELRAWGVPAATLAAVRAEVDDDEARWVPAWTRAAEAAERERRPLRAAMLYGAAKFPWADDEARRGAYARQLACFERASRRFPCYFERRIVRVPSVGGEVALPAHFYAAFWHGRDHWRERPIVLLSGGLETWKVELHRLALALTVMGDFLVVAVDLPGTGESPAALAAGCEALYGGVLADFAADLGGPRPCAAVGWGLGGGLAARLAASGGVAGAVALAGDDGAGLPDGLAGPLGLALRLPAPPAAEDLPGLLAPFALPPPSPGVLVLAGAAARPRRAAAAAIGWLRRHMHGPSPLNQGAHHLTTALLPRRAARPPAGPEAPPDP